MKNKTERFLPVEKTKAVETALGLSPANQRTTNQMLTELVNHYMGRGNIPNGTALNAVAQNLPWLPTNSLIVFLAKPHSNWVEHVVVLDPTTRELLLDQNPYLKTKWNKTDRYEALFPGGRISTFVPLREITVDEVIRKGGLHYEVRKLQVDMQKRHEETQNVVKENKRLERERQSHFWPLKPKDDPRVKNKLPQEPIVPHLAPLPQNEEDEPNMDEEDHFAPIPQEVVLPESEKKPVDPMDEETIRKLNRIKELDDKAEKDEMLRQLEEEIRRKRETEEQQDDGEEEPEDEEEEVPEGKGTEDEEKEENNEENEDDTGGPGSGGTDGEEVKEEEEPEGEEDKDGKGDGEGEEEPEDEEQDEEQDEEEQEDEETDQTEEEKKLKKEDENEDEEQPPAPEKDSEDEETEDNEEDEGEKESEKEDDKGRELTREDFKKMSDQEMEEYFLYLMSQDDESDKVVEGPEEEPQQDTEKRPKKQDDEKPEDEPEDEPEEDDDKEKDK